MAVCVTVEDGDAVDRVAEATRRMAKNNVMAELSSYEDGLKAAVKDLYMGLEIIKESE